MLFSPLLREGEKREGNGGQKIVQGLTLLPATAKRRRCDILEDRARALSLVFDPMWERCKCDIITTLLELCRTYSAPFEKNDE